jgi:hypothetical protein
MVSVIVGVWVFGRADVFHLVDAAALGTALDGAVAGDLCGEEGVSRTRLGECGEKVEGNGELDVR